MRRTRLVLVRVLIGIVALATTGIDTLALAEATVALERARHERDALAATAKAQARELERRAEWGFGLARELDDRTAWAKSLEADLEKTQARMEIAEVELDRVRPFEAELTRVHTSRSWRITQPLRTGTVFARRLRSSLAFRLRRALSLFGRARRSLQMRGIGGTLRRASRSWCRYTTTSRTRSPACARSRSTRAPCRSK